MDGDDGEVDVVFHVFLSDARSQVGQPTLLHVVFVAFICSPSCSISWLISSPIGLGSLVFITVYLSRTFLVVGRLLFLLLLCRSFDLRLL